MKKFLRHPKRIFAFLLALSLGMGTANAYDFYKNCTTGQRLYYNIIDATNHYVEITYPGTSYSSPWDGYTKPTGNITLPTTVTNGGVTYTVTRIGDVAFRYCANLTGSLAIPNTVTSIGEMAFEGCSGFTGKLTIPASVTWINDYAFKNCTGFTSMAVLPVTPPTLGTDPFQGVSTSIPVTVPCESFSAYQSASGWNAFTNMYGDGCDYLIYSINDDGVSVTVTHHVNGTSATGQLVIPPTTTINGTTYTVTAIGDYAFTNCSGLTGSPIIPNTVTEIGACAFWNCTGFSGNLTLPNSLTAIWDFAFANCWGLTGSLSIPNSVTSIGQSAFYRCNHFTGSLIIPNSVTSIGTYAFRGCTGFTGGLTIGNSVTSIGTGAFQNCTFNGLTINMPNIPTNFIATVEGTYGGTLFIGNSVTSIGNNAFQNCTFNGLSINMPNIPESCVNGMGGQYNGSLIIGNSVTTIGNYAFFNRNDFTGSLTIGNSVTSIGEAAFYGCQGFTGNLTIPGSVTTIGGSAFYNCTGFSGNLTIGNSVTTIGEEAFVACNGFVGNLILGNSVTTIGDLAFYLCSGFTGGLTIPNSVTSIGESAFQGCSSLNGLLTLGTGVNSMGSNAFRNCTGFTSIRALPEYPPTTSSTAFTNVPKNILVEVPCHTLSQYQAAQGWSEFTNMQGVLCGGVVVPSAFPSEGGTVTGNGYYTYGQTCTVTATPNAGYIFLHWSIDGEVVSCSPTYSWTMEGETVQIKAVFMLITGTLVGEATSTNIYLPSYSYYKYSLTQQIYTPDEIGGSTTINSLSFFNEGPTKTRSYDIYMVHTSQSYFTSNTLWISATTDNRVFSGTVTMTQGYWTTIEFDTPFAYNGSSNLAVIVDDNTGSYTPSPYMACRTYNASGYQAMRVYSDGTNYDPSNPSSYNGTRLMVKNQILLNSYVYDVTVSVSGNGTGTVSGAGQYVSGMTCSLTATPDEGNLFLHWSQDGTVVSCDATYNFSVTENVQLEAVFMPITGIYVSNNLKGNSEYLPSFSYYKYGLSEQIYTPDELGGSTIINSISLCNVGDTETRSYDIYLMHTTKNSFSSGTDWVPVSSANLVFSGTVTMSKGYWTTFELDTPFAYNGTSNLLLVMDDNTGSYTGAPHMSCRGYMSNEQQSIYIYSDGTNYNPSSPSGYSGTLFAIPFKNQLILNGSGTCARVIPYAYGFEDSDELDCWSMVDCHSSTGIVSTSPYTGSKSFRFYYNTTPPQYLISPELIGTEEGLVVEFRYKNNSTAYTERFQVGWSTTDDDVDSFTWETEVTISDTRWKLYHNIFPAGTRFVAVKFNSDDQYYLYLDDFSFTAPEACTRPGALQATDVTSNSATLSWSGWQNIYTVRYRPASVFYDEFEEGFDQWTTIDADGDGHNWEINNTWGGHDSPSMAVSASYILGVGPQTPDNYLVTPRIPLGGVVKFYACAQDAGWAAEHFGVAVSTSGNTNASDFTTIQEWTMAAKGGGAKTEVTRSGNRTQGNWYQYTVDLSAYAGQYGYVAIRHFDCTDMYYLDVDDFGIYASDALSDWTTVLVAGSDLTVTDLLPGTEYEWQVQGSDCDGEGSFTEWSMAHSFVTPFCNPEDQCELTFTLTDSYGDGWNGAAINVVDVETGSSLGLMSNQNVAKGEETETYTLAVCDGRELRFEWVSGNYDSECSYVVTDINGNEVFSGIGAMSEPFTYTVNCSAVQVQTVALTAGLNWFSTYVEITLEDLQAALVATGNTSIMIASQSDGKTTYANGRWRGQLTTLDVKQMYKITVGSACEIALEGLPVNPAEHPVTIHNGSNWIGFPLGTSMTLTDAFAGFAVNGDMVVSQSNGSATYTGGRWRGSLTTLEPGQGYNYKSASSTTKVLRFGLGQAYVDLDLPSGLLWATCNVGATSPEDYGDYFAWGETQPKDTYSWSTYQYCNGSNSTLTKYCNNSSYGYNGFTDNLTTLLPEDDAAAANWGGNWRMPTKEEFQELYNNTTVTWTQQNGVNGRLFTASNGNSLFLPAAGYRFNSSLYDAGSYGYYWSSSLITEGPDYAWDLYFDSGNYGVSDDYRYYGQSVRPVRSAE